MQSGTLKARTFCGKITGATRSNAPKMSEQYKATVMPADSAKSQHNMTCKIAYLAPCSRRRANWKGPNAPARSKRGKQVAKKPFYYLRKLGSQLEPSIV
eukprot:3520890-Pyramimonas_sp.AAC.1